MSDLEDLAARIKDLEALIGARNATQLDSSTIDVGQGDESIGLSDAVVGANESVVFTIPGLQEALDLNETRLQEASEAVQAAMDAADAAEVAGLAAGEEASQAADDALVKAQEALDAAAAAGGGAVYTNRAPTAADPGKPGAQWFVWDANYHVTGYYVYKDDTAKWVATVLDDGTFGNLSAARLTSGFIDAARIAAGSLTAAVLAADTITSREIAADAILARNIKALEITGAKIAAATITGGNIAANTIVAGNIKAGTLTANEIAANTITANEINLDTLNGKTITGVTVTGAQLATSKDPNAPNLGTVKIANSSMTWYNDTAGKPHTAFSFLGDTGALRFVGRIALNSSGSSVTDPALAMFTLPQYLPWVVSGPGSYMSLSCSFVEVGTVLYAKQVQAEDYRLKDGTALLPLTGTVTYPGTLAANSSDTLTVGFPTGFTKPPLVNANGSNSRVTVGINSVTKDAVTFALGNWTSGASGSPIIYYTATPRP